jgi:hypothetical protein
MPEKAKKKPTAKAVRKREKRVPASWVGRMNGFGIQVPQDKDELYGCPFCYYKKATRAQDIVRHVFTHRNPNPARHFPRTSMS